MTDGVGRADHLVAEARSGNGAPRRLVERHHRAESEAPADRAFRERCQATQRRDHEPAFQRERADTTLVAVDLDHAGVDLPADGRLAVRWAAARRAMEFIEQTILIRCLGVSRAISRARTISAWAKDPGRGGSDFSFTRNVWTNHPTKAIRGQFLLPEFVAGSPSILSEPIYFSHGWLGFEPDHP